jgi:carbamoyltransferase
MITAAVSLAGHDASITILKNNKIDLFVQEERLNRKKHSALLDPLLAEILKKYIKIDQLILCNFHNQDQVNNFLKLLNNIKKVIIDNKNHHLFHSCTAFYLSGFKQATSLVIDGWGSPININNNIFYETTSIYNCSYPNKIIPLYKKVTYDTNRNYYCDTDLLENNFKEFELDISHRLDIGVMYGSSSGYLGFNRLDGGKTMGLSSYGKISKNVPNILFNNEANMNLFKNDRTLDIKNNFKLKNNSFKYKADYAFALQKALEKIFIKKTQYILNKTNSKNIVFSGGCALNILGNSVIKDTFKNINLFIDPIANDASQSLGAALYYYYDKTKDTRQFKFSSIYLGPKYKTTEIKKQIKKWLLTNSATSTKKS